MVAELMKPRMTLATKRVLETMLAAGAGTWMYGLQVARAADLQSGTVQPILERWTRYGWLESRREHGEPKELQRPLRRYYRLSEVGLANMIGEGPHA